MAQVSQSTSWQQAINRARTEFRDDLLQVYRKVQDAVTDLLQETGPVDAVLSESPGLLPKDFELPDQFRVVADYDESRKGEPSNLVFGVPMVVLGDSVRVLFDPFELLPQSELAAGKELRRSKHDVYFPRVPPSVRQGLHCDKKKECSKSVCHARFLYTLCDWSYANIPSDTEAEQREFEGITSFALHLLRRHRPELTDSQTGGLLFPSIYQMTKEYSEVQIGEPWYKVRSVSNDESRLLGINSLALLWFLSGSVKEGSENKEPVFLLCLWSPLEDAFRLPSADPGGTARESQPSPKGGARLPRQPTRSPEPGSVDQKAPPAQKRIHVLPPGGNSRWGKLHMAARSALESRFETLPHMIESLHRQAGTMLTVSQHLAVKNLLLDSVFLRAKLQSRATELGADPGKVTEAVMESIRSVHAAWSPFLGGLAEQPARTLELKVEDIKNILEAVFPVSVIGWDKELYEKRSVTLVDRASWWAFFTELASAFQESCGLSVTFLHKKEDVNFPDKEYVSFRVEGEARAVDEAGTQGALPDPLAPVAAAVENGLYRYMLLRQGFPPFYWSELEQRVRGTGFAWLRFLAELVGARVVPSRVLKVGDAAEDRQKWAYQVILPTS